MEFIEISSSAREQLIDITNQTQKAARQKNLQSGALHLFCMHTTCGLTINEGADPDVQADLMKFFGEIAPFRNDWKHREGNSDAHIRSSLLGVSLLVPVFKGELVLGTWQHIYLYEGDGPRTRRICLQWILAD